MGTDERRWIIRSASAREIMEMLKDFERLLIVEDGEELEPGKLDDVVPLARVEAAEQRVFKLEGEVTSLRAQLGAMTEGLDYPNVGNPDERRKPYRVRPVGAWRPVEQGGEDV